MTSDEATTTTFLTPDLTTACRIGPAMLLPEAVVDRVHRSPEGDCATAGTQLFPGLVGHA